MLLFDNELAGQRARGGTRAVSRHQQRCFRGPGACGYPQTHYSPRTRICQGAICRFVRPLLGYSTGELLGLGGAFSRCPAMDSELSSWYPVPAVVHL